MPPELQPGGQPAQTGGGSRARPPNVTQRTHDRLQRAPHGATTAIEPQRHDRQPVRVGQRRAEAAVPGVVVDEVGLHRVGPPVEQMLAADRIVRAPVEVELLEQVRAAERATDQERPKGTLAQR
uniref:Uncharacterized protein n=1 Tax=Anopheles melas TaxID=34690 RepID=A0A182TUT5_9DIPT